MLSVSGYGVLARAIVTQFFIPQPETDLAWTRVWHLLSIRFSGIEIFVFSQSIRRSEIDQTNVEMADVWDITGPGRGARPVARQKCRNVGSRGAILSRAYAGHCGACDVVSDEKHRPLDPPTR